MALRSHRPRRSRRLRRSSNQQPFARRNPRRT
jgi:hypothetical protein